MSYKGYTVRVAHDEEDGIFVGEVEGIQDLVTFQAARAEDIEREFRASVDVYLAFCAEQGITPQHRE